MSRMADYRAAIRRFERTGDRDALGMAAARIRAAFREGEIDAVQYAAGLTTLGIHFGALFEATGLAEDSEFAIGAGQLALQTLPAGHRDRPLYLSNLAADLATYYDRFGDLDMLDGAIEYVEEALGLTPAGHRQRATMLSNLSVYRRLRVAALGERDDLEQSLALAVQAVRETAANDPNRAKHLFNAGVVHRLRFDSYGQMPDLDAAIWHGFAAVQAAATDPVQRARALSSLGLAHRTRHERTGNPADLDAAIGFGVDAARACPAGHRELATYLQNVSIAFGARYEFAGGDADLDAAVWHADESLRLTPADSPDRLPRMLNAGNDHRRRYERRGDPADLEWAIACLTDAVHQVPPQDPELAAYLTALGIAHSTRFERLGHLADLEAARNCAGRALALTPTDHTDRAQRVSNWAAYHLRRYARLGEPLDVETALKGSLEAVRRTPPGAVALRQRLQNLGYAYRVRYQLTGAVADLDAAIRCGLDAVAACPPDAADRADHLSALGFAHLQRSVPLGADGDDLDAGLGYVTAALAATTAGHPDRPGHLADLGTAYRLRFTRRGDPADLDEAIRLGDEALRTMASDHADRAVLLSIQSDAHDERFRLSGRDADAVAMVDLAAEAVRLTPAGHADTARRRADLGETYRVRADAASAEAGSAGSANRAGGAAEDRRRAVELLTEAVAGIPEGHPSRAVRLTQLARACLPGDRERAVGLLREAATAATALPVRRIEAARLWGDIRAASGDAAGAADAYATAVGLLPLLAWRGLGRAERESRLASTAGLASLATAWAIRAGRPETAVELLEQGRSVLWAQTLQTRTDLTELRAVRPDLADLLAGLRVRLDGYADRAAYPAELGRPPLPDDRERSAVRYRRDAEAWEDAVGQVRALDGFATFLAPTPFATLRRAGAEGPVVLVNVSPVGCDALIVTADGVRQCPLPDLAERECGRRAAELSLAVEGRAGDRDVEAESEAPALFDLLGWLWDTICGPVLRVHPAPERLWWCPTGTLSALPLHAAGHYGTPGGETLPDATVCSYTPTLGALLRARPGTGATEPPAVLAVGMPTTPRIGEREPADLPGVSDELDRLGRRLECRQLRTATRQELESGTPIPADRLPTVERVLAALGTHSWVHLACHGGQDPHDPSSGAVYLADGPLTVLRIAAMDLRAAELAFLSACRTAVGGVDLRDEVIHLAAAMQVAGYRHVVATAWSISDEHTPVVVDRTYERLVGVDGGPDAGRSARALHLAVAALRAELPDRPELWAAYLHVGP